MKPFGWSTFVRQEAAFCRKAALSHIRWLKRMKTLDDDWVKRVKAKGAITLKVRVR